VGEIHLYDSVIGEFVPVSAGDAVRVEVRTSPWGSCGAVDVAATRPFALFSFLERFLQREGFGTQFLFDSSTGEDVLYELCEDPGSPGSSHDSDSNSSGFDGPEMSLLEVPRSEVDRWVNVCFGADREGHEWLPAPESERILLSDALRCYGSSAVAFYLLGSHYSQPLGDAATGLRMGACNARRLGEALKALVPDQPSPPDMAHYLEGFRDALANDLDTPHAFVALFEWVLEAERRGGGVGDKDLRVMLDVLDCSDLVLPVATA
jgi:hypothetical protein